MRIYKKDHKAPKIFKSDPYNKYKKKQKPESGAFKYEKTKSEAIKEALEDAEINYGLDDHLKKDKQYNQVFKKYYDETYENVSPDNEPKELSIFIFNT